MVSRALPQNTEKKRTYLKQQVSENGVACVLDPGFPISPIPFAFRHDKKKKITKKFPTPRSLISYVYTFPFSFWWDFVEDVRDPYLPSVSLNQKKVIDFATCVLKSSLSLSSLLVCNSFTLKSCASSRLSKYHCTDW